MFETDRVEDMFTDKHVRVKGGHYIDTANDSDRNVRFELWVRHNRNYYLVNTDDWTCHYCRDACQKITLTDEQKRNTVALMALYNRT